ncbi:MAG TPA: nuclear transport factor 2 family protein, partial [Pseudonocardiaceae bacterium]|nr:nuclear transport factor 2 family protein [Pseudonocardiaceae bacterium]
FFDALVSGDSAAVAELLAEDFVIVSVRDGSSNTRADLIAAIDGGLVFPAVTDYPDEAVVRVVGEVGIVVGRTAMSFTGPDGTPFEAGSRYTHVYQRSGDGWRLLSAQGTEISRPG